VLVTHSHIRPTTGMSGRSQPALGACNRLFWYPSMTGSAGRVDTDRAFLACALHPR